MRKKDQNMERIVFDIPEVGLEVPEVIFDIDPIEFDIPEVNLDKQAFNTM